MNKAKKSCSPSTVIIIAVLSLSVFASFSCSKETSPRERGFFVSPDRNSFGMDMYGRARTGSLYVPPAYTGERPYSLLIALHGAGVTGKTLETLGFNEAADELGFIVAYPDGVGFRWDAPDDTPFVMTLILELRARFSIDPDRVYLTGHSAGAIEAYELAVALPGQFAAVAPVAGLMTTGNSPAGHPPLSVLHIHSKDDLEVPYDGTEEWGLCSVDESLAYWRAVNERDAPDAAPAETAVLGEGVEMTLWRGTQADTALVRMSSGGHAWPALATGRIMDFFYNHPARAGRVAVTCGDGRLVAGLVRSLPLRATIDSARKISRVEYYASGAKVAETGRHPFTAVWENPEPGCHRVSVRVMPADGEPFVSTLNQTVIVAEESLPPGELRATCSSVENDGLLPAFATDGNMGTRWSSGWTDNESLTVDLGKPRSVSGITLAWESAYASAYAIELSPDGVSWERAFETKSGDGGFDHVRFDARTARAVRFVGTKRGSEWGYSLWELLVHGE